MLSEGGEFLSCWSIWLLKSFQCAFLKFMNVFLLCDFLFLWVMNAVVRMGR